MDRRAFLGTLLAGAAMPAGAARPAVANENGQPNIILVVLDDMRAADWRALPKTKQLLRGTRFRNFFTPNPFCGPSRVSLLTGQHSHTHGISADAYQGMRDAGILDRTLNVVLHEAGYRTALFGKLNNGYRTTEVPVGWDRFFSYHQGTGPYFDFVVTDDGNEVAFPNSYLTTAIGRRAAAFIRDADAPFFCYLAPSAPHTPAEPHSRYRKKFRRARVRNVPAFLEPNVIDKPLAVREPTRQRHGRQPRSRYVNLERRRLRTLASVDDEIERMVNAVKARGEWDTTYWFICSDNGWCQGSHGWTWKLVPYDASVRIPLLVAGPNISKGSSEQFVANIDLAPTICDLAGTTMPAPVDGENIFTTTRDAMLLEGTYPGIEYQGVRTREYLYTEWATGERELYDLVHDPEERTNQLADWEGLTPTADPDVVAMLEQRLEQLRG